MRSSIQYGASKEEQLCFLGKEDYYTHNDSYSLCSHISGMAIARGWKLPHTFFPYPNSTGKILQSDQVWVLLHPKLNCLGQDWSTCSQIQNRSLRCYENLMQKFHLPTTSKGMQNTQVSPGDRNFKDLCFELGRCFPKFHLNAFLVCLLSFIDNFCGFTVLIMKYRISKTFSLLVAGPFRKDK